MMMISIRGKSRMTAATATSIVATSQAKTPSTYCVLACLTVSACVEQKRACAKCPCDPHVVSAGACTTQVRVVVEAIASCTAQVARQLSLTHVRSIILFALIRVKA